MLQTTERLSFIRHDKISHEEQASLAVFVYRPSCISLMDTTIINAAVAGEAGPSLFFVAIASSSKVYLESSRTSRTELFLQLGYKHASALSII